MAAPVLFQRRLQFVRTTSGISTDSLRNLLFQVISNASRKRLNVLQTFIGKANDVWRQLSAALLESLFESMKLTLAEFPIDRIRGPKKIIEQANVRCDFQGFNRG